MSIRTNLKKIVEVLFKRLHQVKEKVADEDIKYQINCIETILNEKKDLFTAAKEWEQELIECLRDFDRHLRKLENDKMENIDKDSMRSSIDSGVELIKEWASLLHAEFTTILNRKTRNDDDMGQTQTQTQTKTKKHPQLSLEDSVFQKILKNLQVSYDNLRLQLRLCLLFLSIFPENSAIKKRVLIYWWVAKGLVRKTASRTAEEVGEDIFDKLLQLELIIPYGKVKNKSPIVNTCQIHPWFRYVLVQLAQEGSLFHSVSSLKPPSSESSESPDILLLDGQHFSGKEGKFEDYTTIFNVNARYVHFGSEWLAKMKKLIVLQLGRWQESPQHHIEVVNDPFFNDFKTQKQCLKYLSLRGISRIIALPPSILELVSLEILDLKACHNLEILPPDISSLSKLTHLDVSQCYLLESMPKGLNKLASLQVLKGFIMGKSPSKVDDLKIPGKLKRLSIHIGSEAEIQPGELDKLKDLESLCRLKISWAVASEKLKAQVEKENISFPPSLEKLNLEGLPHKKLPEWLKPSNLKALKKLYIMGGKFDSLDHDKTDTETWKVEILRLKYLNNLEIQLDKLQDTFPSLKYAQRIKIDKIENSATPREHVHEWLKEDKEASM